MNCQNNNTVVIETVQRYEKRLQRWVSKVEEIFPTCIHDIPPTSPMDTGKLGYNDAVTSDTCNPAWETRIMLVEQIIYGISALRNSTDNINAHRVDC